MSLTLKTREVSGVTILDLTGKITLGEGGKALRDEVRAHLAKGVRKMVLNLAEVSYIDSSGLGELVSAYTATKNLGGELKLMNLTHKVRDLLVITKLLTVFDVKEDEAAAVASFG
jgi:anti-sigma B factor antagonist